MAEKVEIEIPGIGLIEAKNAASEATLLEILDILKTTQKNIQSNAKQQQKQTSQQGSSSSQGGGQGGPNMKNLTQQTNAAAKGMSVMAQAGQLAGQYVKTFGYAVGATTQAVNGLAKGAGVAAGATLSFGKNLLDLGASMASVIETMANVGDSTTRAAGALNMIPIVGPALARSFGAVAGAVEGVVKSYQTAASVGATFNGSVADMSRAASGAGMTLDQFAGLIKSNSESMMLLGGTTETGAKRFGELAKQMQTSGVGSELMRLGYTTDQINGGMARYIGLMGKAGSLQNMTTTELARQSGTYLKELDALAKVTGQSREQLEADQKRLMSEAKVRAAMAGLDAESQRQMMNYITSFPQEAQGAIADMLATGNATTEESIQLMSMLPETAQKTMEFGRILQQGGKISMDALNQQKNASIQEARESQLRNKTRGMFDEQANKAYLATANLATHSIDGLSKAQAEQAKATAKANLAEDLTKAKQRLAEFSNSFQLALANSGMLDAMLKTFETLGTFVQEVILPIFNVFATAITAIIPVITSLLIPAFKAIGEFIQNVAVPAFNILGMWIRDAVIPIFKEAWKIVSDVVGSLFDMFNITLDVGDGLGTFEEILYDVAYFVEDNLQPILIGFGVLIGTVIVGKVIAFGAAIVGMMAPIAGFAASIATATFRLVTMAAKAAISTLAFVAMNPPVLALVTAIGLGAYLFKKLGFDLGMVSDGLKWASSWISTLFLKLQQGIFTVLNKIPGFRGDFTKDLEEIGKKLEANEEERKKIEQDIAKRRQQNLDQQKAEEQKKLDDKAKAEEQAVQDEAAAKSDAQRKEEQRQEKSEQRQEARRQRGERREREARERQQRADQQALADKTEREKKAEADKKAADDAAKNPKETTVDLQNPIEMLKSFAKQQNSAFSQEAKALDDKERARMELKAASEEYTKALTDEGKAKTAEERKIAEDRIKAAQERLDKARANEKEADAQVAKAIERMKLAKEGKDPGPPKPTAEARPAPPKPAEPPKAEPPKAEPPKAPARPAGTPPPISQDVEKNLQLIKAAMEKQGMKDPKYIAATLGNVMKETGGKSISENLNYANTSNDRIRKIFGSRASGKTDKELDEIKKDPQQMGEMMYGSKTKLGQQMGNTEPGDGWKYRGRGFIQLTGKNNYAAASKAIYGDNRLVENPDLVNDPAVAAEVSAWYMKKGQKGMAAKMGIDTNNMTQEQANQLATSQIAGKDVRTAGDYLKGEVMDKVTKHAASAQIQAIAGAPATGAPTPTATATPKPETSGAGGGRGGRGGPTAEELEAHRQQQAQAQAAKPPVAAGRPTEAKPPEAKPPEAEAKPKEEPQAVGTMQSLIKDGIVPTTIAFQDLVNKGLKPFQGMMSGMQVKTPLGKERGALDAEAGATKFEVAQQQELSSAYQQAKNDLQGAVQQFQKAGTEEEKAAARAKMDDAGARIEKFGQALEATKSKIDAPVKKSDVAQNVKPVELDPAPLKDVSKSVSTSIASVSKGIDLTPVSDLVGSMSTFGDENSKIINEMMNSGAKVMLASADPMINGLDLVSTNLSNNMINGLDLTTTNLSESLGTNLQVALDDSFVMFNTDLASNFAQLDTFGNDLSRNFDNVLDMGLGQFTTDLSGNFGMLDDFGTSFKSVSQELSEAESRRAELESIMNDGQARTSNEWKAIEDEAMKLDSQIAGLKEIKSNEMLTAEATPVTSEKDSLTDYLKDTFANIGGMTGMDQYSASILKAVDNIGVAESQISQGEQNIREMEEGIAQAEAALSSGMEIGNRQELEDYIKTATQNIAAQKDTIDYNKSAIAKNRESMDYNILARAEADRSELIAQAESDAKKKLAEEEARREKEKQQMQTQFAENTQEGGMASGIDLNTALSELIAISKRTADLNEQQLSVQNQLGGNLFG